MVPGYPDCCGVAAESQSPATLQMKLRVFVVLRFKLTQAEQRPGVGLLRFERDRLLKRSDSFRIMRLHVFDGAELPPSLLPVRPKFERIPIRGGGLFKAARSTSRLGMASFLFEFARGSGWRTPIGGVVAAAGFHNCRGPVESVASPLGGIHFRGLTGEFFGST